MPTATTPPGWPTTRSTSCCSTAIRSPGPALASQPTLSRFENAVGWEALRDMAHVLADTVIETQRRRLKGRADPDHDRPRPHRRPDPRPAGVHVLQRPLRHVVLPADRRDGDLQRRGRAVRGGVGVAAGQRAGHARGAGDPAAPAGQAARGLSGGHVRVRLDGGFAHPKLFKFLEQQQVEYVVAMASNSRLEKRARRLMGKARMRPRPPARPPMCMGRRGMRRGAGSASGG